MSVVDGASLYSNRTWRCKNGLHGSLAGHRLRAVQFHWAVGQSALPVPPVSVFALPGFPLPVAVVGAIGGCHQWQMLTAWLVPGVASGRVTFKFKPKSGLSETF